MHFCWGQNYYHSGILVHIVLKIEYICYFIRLMVDSYIWNCHWGTTAYVACYASDPAVSPYNPLGGQQPITPFPTIGPGQGI